MPSAVATSAEHDQALKAYRRLVRLLKAVRGTFALILVESQLNPEDDTRWQERLRRDLEQENSILQVVDLSFDEWDLLEAVDSTEIEEDRVLLLRGLEKTPTATNGSSRPPAYSLLNIDRESLEQRFPIPWIVWCNPSSYEALRRHAPDFFDHFTGLVHFTRRRYRSMASVLEGFVKRHELEEAVTILAEATPRDDSPFTLAFLGAGGFGKTTLAQALCHDERIRRIFSDGVLWTTMGADLGDAGRLARIQDLIRFCTGAEPGAAFTTVHAASRHLRDVLAGQRVLLVVDDVWEPDDVEPFRDLGAQVTLLVTTRNRRSLPADSHIVSIGAMQRDEAVALLAADFTSAEEPFLRRLAGRLGNWPLLLALVSRQILQEVKEGLGIEEAVLRIGKALAGQGVTAFDVPPGRRNASLRETLKISLRHLSEVEQERFTSLMVFRGDTDVPIDVLERFWQLDRSAVRTLCFQLRDLSLLFFDAQLGVIRLHDVVREFLLGERQKELEALHRRLLTAVRPADGRWSNMPLEEVYMWRHLADHLLAAGKREELYTLLLDFIYLRRKLEVAGIVALLDDFKIVKEEEVRAVNGALSLAAHVLAAGPAQLAGQLKGRLAEDSRPAIRRLLRQIDAWSEDTASLRPRFASLTPPGGPLLKTLEGHTDWVEALGVIDERRVVSASHDRSLRIWDVTTGESLRQLVGHTGAVSALSVIDKRRLVSGTYDGSLRLWDVETGETLRALNGHTDWITALVAVDERHLVSASYDGSLRLWDVETGKLLRTLVDREDPLTALAKVDEHRIVTASRDLPLRIWDLGSGECLGQLGGRQDWVTGLAAVDKNRIVSASRDGTLRLQSLDSGENLWTFPGHSETVNAVAVFGPDRVVSASRDKTLRLWDLDSGKSLGTLEGHTDWISDVVCLTPRRLVSASYDRTLRIWDTSSRRKGRFEHGGGISSVASIDDRQAVSASRDTTLQIWDVDSGEVLRVLQGHDDWVNAVAVLASSSGKRLVSASRDRTLRLWDVDTGQALCVYEGHVDDVTSVASIDARRFVSASRDRTLRVWDLDSGQTLQGLAGHREAITAVTVTDAGYIVSASMDKTLRLWDPDTGESLRSFEGHDQGVSSVTTISGNRIVSASYDGTLRLWDLDSGEALRALEGHTREVHAVVVIDSRRVVSASSDRTLRLWELETSQAIDFTLDVAAIALASHRDGRMVLAGDPTGKMHFLDVVGSRAQG